MTIVSHKGVDGGTRTMDVVTTESGLETRLMPFAVPATYNEPTIITGGQLNKKLEKRHKKKKVVWRNGKRREF